MPFASQAQRAGRRMGKWGKKRPFWFSRGWKRIAVGLWDTLTCFPSISFWRKSTDIRRWYLHSGHRVHLLPHPLVLINKFLQSGTQTSFLHVFAHPDCLNQMHVKPRFFHLPQIRLHIPLSYRPPFLWGASSVWPRSWQDSELLCLSGAWSLSCYWWNAIAVKSPFCFSGMSLPAKWGRRYRTSFSEP